MRAQKNSSPRGKQHDCTKGPLELGNQECELNTDSMAVYVGASTSGQKVKKDGQIPKKEKSM